MTVKIIEPTKNLVAQKAKLRVAAYARVSTASLAQEDSFENQVKFYEEKIKNNSNYEFVKVYADQALSGTTTKRPEFLQLIKDCQAGKIDLILTKSISRFSRNISDLMQYVKLLKELKINLIFEEDHIELNDEKSTFLLSILGAVAQMEVENTASHVKWTLHEKMKRGELIGGTPLGYKNNAGKLEIIEEEAEIVRYIFKRYLEGAGARTIRNELEVKNIHTKSGTAFWYDSTIVSILRNEKYCGDLLQGKTVVTSTLAHKRARNNGISARYFSENAHEAIISRDDFEKAQQILASRVKVVDDNKKLGSTVNSGQYTFSSKVECYFCGKKYVRRINHVGTKYEMPFWSCGGKAYRNSCKESKNITEEKLKEAFVRLVHALQKEENSIFKLDEAKIKELFNTKEKYDAQLETLNKNIEKYTKRKAKLLELVLDDLISKEDYALQLEQMELEILKNQDKIETINEELQEEQAELKSVQQVRDLFDKNDVSVFSEELFNSLVEKIVIGGERVDENGELIVDREMITFKLKYNNLKIDF